MSILNTCLNSKQKLFSIEYQKNQTCFRDVNSPEIAIPGSRSTLDFARVRTFTSVIRVGSPVGAMGGGDHRPDPAPFLVDDGTPSPPADDQHSW